MLAIHWAPVKHSKNILNNGIRKNRNGVYCFPLTGHQSLDKWWMKELKRSRRDGKKYNGFIFRLEENDLPAYFGHFIGATTREQFDKPIDTLKKLGEEIQETIIWRIGERLLGYGMRLRNEDILRAGKEEIRKRPELYQEVLSDARFMEYILEDYQIVLSQSISAKRILKVIPPTEQFGRIIHKEKKNKYIEE
ncbi:hypothetical protein [Paenibacillus sp. NPDC058071]|uniref:hypothetical protein n=1 Tax=Paenibacillus sp. NPDC058071 TaxID=3346326 RepID=UPI0036D9D65D